MRVSWLTDVHLNLVADAARAAFYERVRAERPDVLLVSGDTGEADSIVRYTRELGQIARTYVVLGNHDFYGSSIERVREAMRATGAWLPAIAPVELDGTVLVGVDGWGDARCGDVRSRLQLSDWHVIDDLRGLGWPPEDREAALKRLGKLEAEALRAQLAQVAAGRDVLVLTHVPPFPEACWHEGARSDDDWLPWFTCVAVGEVLREFAATAASVTVLCGHTHGRGEYREGNILVRTGGWAPGEDDYGNPVVQDTWELTAARTR